MIGGGSIDAASGRQAAADGAGLLRWFAAGGARRVAALAFAAFLLFLPGQAAIPPSDRDEARFAQAAKQMLETGDFVNIRFQDEARNKKPVGIYWLQAASAALAGGPAAPIAAYRVPSLLGGAAAAGLTAWAVAPLVGWPAAALAAAMVATTPLLQVEARIAKTDAALLAAIVVAMGALARVALAGAGAGMRRLFWAAVGAGVLLKGPIVVIPVAGALGGLASAGRGRAALAALKPLEGLAIVAAITAPWLVLITVETGGAFWAESVGRDLLGKAAAGQEGHWGPPGYHTLAALGTFWPWAALLPLGGLLLWARRAEPWARFLAGWALATWVVFEVAPTKLPHYVLPAFPALAAAVAAALLAGARAPARGWRVVAAVAFGLPAAALVLGAIGAVPAIEGRVSPPAIAFGLGAAVALALAGRALLDWRLPAFALTAGAGAALAFAGVFGFALPALDRAFVSPRLAAETARWRCGAEGPVALTGYREPSAVFLLGTRTLTGTGVDAAAALAEGRAPLAWIEARDADRFAAAAAERGLGTVALATVEGFNYSRGRPVALTLRATPAQAARCDP